MVLASPDGNNEGILESQRSTLPPDRTEVNRRRALAFARSEAMDRLASLAAHLLNCRYAQVSVLADQQIVAGHHGFQLAASEGPLEDSLCTVTVRGGGALIVSDATADVRVNHLPPVIGGSVGAYLGVPFTVDGQAMGALCAFDPTPRTWSELDLSRLQALAESVSAELDGAATEEALIGSLTRLDLGFAAASIGSFDWNILTGDLQWDARLKELFGYTDQTFTNNIESFWSPILDEDRARVRAAIDTSIEFRGDYETEFRIKLPSGEIRWIAARGRVLAGPDGRASRMLGANYDTTDVHSTSNQISRVLDTITDVFIAVDNDWKITLFNAAAENRLKRGRDEVLGQDLWRVFPHLRNTTFEEHHRDAMRTQQPVTFRDYSTLLDGFFEVRVFPNPDGLSAYLVDVSAERWAEAQRTEAVAARERAAADAESANARLAFLAEVGQVLVSSFNVNTTIPRVLDLVVPRIAAHAAVHLWKDDRLHLVASKAPSEQENEDFRFIMEHGGDSTSFSTGAEYVVASGKGQFFDRYSDKQLDEFLTNEEVRAAWMRLQPSSSVVMPLSARGHTLGTLTLGRAHEQTMSVDDMRLFEVLSARLALAIDNAQLFEHQKSTSETLQRSLLTPPPEPNHLHIEVRYLPANATAQVGGDWYDAFLRQDGSTMLVIGDVMGHDVAAAAAMGQLRTMVRTTAYDRQDETPAEILQRVDAMMQGLGVTTLATVVLAVITQDEKERLTGMRRLSWSAAGHLPPILVTNEGRAKVLGGSDLIMGLDADTRRTTQSVELAPNSTLLLYTDGLVERRRKNTEEAIEGLADFASSLIDQPLPAFLDQILDRLGSDGTDDDVAIVAVRLMPEDHDRPAEAGPNIVPNLHRTEP